MAQQLKCDLQNSPENKAKIICYWQSWLLIDQPVTGINIYYVIIVHKISQYNSFSLVTVKVICKRLTL